MNEEKELMQEEKTSFEKKIGDTTYKFTQENGYAPERTNIGNDKKIAFGNQPKKLTRKPNFLYYNIGKGNEGFTKMAGLGLILAIFAIIIIFILNRI